MSVNLNMNSYSRYNQQSAAKTPNFGEATADNEKMEKSKQSFKSLYALPEPFKSPYALPVLISGIVGALFALHVTVIARQSKKASMNLGFVTGVLAGAAIVHSHLKNGVKFFSSEKLKESTKTETSEEGKVAEDVKTNNTDDAPEGVKLSEEETSEKLDSKQPEEV